MANHFVYTPEIGDEILRRFASGETIKRICDDAHMPHRGRVYEWIGADDERLADFQKRFPAARAAHALALSDDIVDIADDGSNDWMTVTKGSPGNEYEVEVINHEHIQRSKLRVDVRLKLMQHHAPNQFGDQLAITGANGGPIEIDDKNTRDVGRRLAFVLATGLRQEQPKVIEHEEADSE